MNLVAPIEHVQTHRPGDSAPVVSPGDLLFVVGTGIYDHIIRTAQSFRFLAPYNTYTHVAIVTDTNGNLAEADGKNVTVAAIQKYLNAEYLLIHPVLSDEDRHECMQFVNESINCSYGWVTIVSIGGNLLTGSMLELGLNGQEICSGLAVRMLEHGGFIFPKDAASICPAELAAYLTVLTAFGQTTSV